MAQSLIATQQQCLVVCNSANNYTAQLKLNPPIVGVKYCRVIPSSPCTITCEFIKPIYTLDSTQSLATPLTQYPADKRIQYQLYSNQIYDQSITVVDDPSRTESSYTFVFQFYNEPLDSVVFQ